MTLSYQSTRVQQPSAAPTLTGAAGTYLFAHRRVNLDGQHTLWVENTTLTALPTDVIPQSYASPSDYLRDEILISDDSGTTWRIIPRGTNDQGTLNVTTFDSGWTIATNTDTQNSTLSSLNLGSFSATNSPSTTFLVYNAGASLATSTINIIDTASGQIASDYSGLVQVSFNRVFAPTGNGNATTIFGQTLIWQTPGQGLNTLSASVGTGSWLEVTVSLVNYPAGGLLSSAIDLGFELIANQRRFPISLENTWLQSTRIINETFIVEPVSAIGTATIRLEPLAINVNGVGVYVQQTQDIVVTLTTVPDTVDLRFNQNGSPRIVPTTDPLDVTEAIFATFDYDNFIISNYVPVAPIRSYDTGYAFGGSVIPRGLFINLDATNSLIVATTQPDVLGVSLFDSTGDYARSGLVWLETGGAFSVGDKLAPDGNGRAILTGSDAAAVAIQESTGVGQFILAELRNQASSGAGAGILNDLADVDTTTTPPVNNDTLIYNSGLATWFPGTLPGGVTSINDLSDVDTVSNPPVNGDILTWNNILSTWEPQPAAGGGGGDTIFVREEIASFFVTLGDSVINFNSIPQTYTHLELEIEMRSDAGPGTVIPLTMSFNGDNTDANYHNQLLAAQNGVTITTESAERDCAQVAHGNALAPSSTVIRIPYYRTLSPEIITPIRHTISHSSIYAAAGDVQTSQQTMFWHNPPGGNPQAITDIAITPRIGGFLNGSRATLYGIGEKTTGGGGGGGSNPEWEHLQTVDVVANSTTVTIPVATTGLPRYRITGHFNLAADTDGYLSLFINNTGGSFFTIESDASGQLNASVTNRIAYWEDFDPPNTRLATLDITITIDPQGVVRAFGTSQYFYDDGFNGNFSRRRAFEWCDQNPPEVSITSLILQRFIGDGDIAAGSQFNIFGSSYS